MDALSNAIEAAGGQTGLAKAIGCSPQRLNNWLHRKSSVPVEFCALIEGATAGQVTRQQLRPDDFWRIWPDLAHLKPADGA